MDYDGYDGIEGGDGRSLSRRGSRDSREERNEVFESAMRRSSFSEPVSTESRAQRRLHRRDRVRARRGAFEWLPVLCSNDLVHGSWWMVAASLVAMIIPIVPLVDLYYPFWATENGSIPLLEDAETFGLLIASGLFFTLGSLAFVRATEDPPLRPIFTCSVHFATDELLAAWLFLFGTIPFVPFIAVYVYYNPSTLLYWGCLVAAVVFNVATYLFVLSCYPSEEKSQSEIISKIFLLCITERSWLYRHISNDWLAGTWVFFYGTLIMLVGALVMLYLSVVSSDSHLEIFDWAATVLDSLIFLVGSAYFCAGSYPQIDPSRAALAGEAKLPEKSEGGVNYHSFEDDRRGLYESDPLLVSTSTYVNKDKMSRKR